MYIQHIGLRDKEGWLFGDVVDYVEVYGSNVAEGLSAFNVGLVMTFSVMMTLKTLNKIEGKISGLGPNHKT